MKQQGIVQFFTHQIFERIVDLYPEYLTDDVLHTLSNKRLTCLELKNCLNITSEGVHGVLERCPNITSLDLSNCSQLNTSSLGKLLVVRKLKILKLNGYSVDNLLSKDIREFCTSLEDIQLEECQIKDNSLFHQNQSFGSALTTVSLCGCQSVTNSFIKALTSVTKSNLKSVNISRTNVDCKALIYLAGFAPSDRTEPVKEIVFDLPADLNDQENERISLHLKDVSAYCAEEVRMKRANVTSSEPITSDSNFDDGPIIPDVLYDSDCESWDIISLDGLDLQIDEVRLSSRLDDVNISDSPTKEIEKTCDPYEDGDDAFDSGDFPADLKIEFLYSLRKKFCPNITSLDITQISFFDDGIGSKCLEIFVESNKCLSDLSLSWESLSNHDLKCIAQNECELRSLSLIDCLEINGEGIKILGDSCHLLVNIDFKGISFIDNASLIHLIEKNPNIRWLGFAESSLSDEVVIKIADVLQEKLVHLDLSWCENITDESVVDLLSKCKELRYLDLRQCEVTSTTLEAIVEYGTQLTSLSLCGVKGINYHASQNCIQNLSALQELTSIDLSWNTFITDETLSLLLHHCVCLRTAILVGLKRISSQPFLPIITNHKSWYCLKDKICKRLQSQLGKDSRSRLKNLARFIIIDKDFYLPFRSLHYAADLRHLSLNYCDNVNDEKLSEIVTVCRGTLVIDDYYGEPIQQKWNPKDLLALSS